MKLPLFIARRYLFAKKSHNVINIISLISAIGIGLGTAALIIILSVYNGFEGLVKDLYATHESDLLITPANGKSFVPQGEAFKKMRTDSRVKAFCEVVEENIFIKYGNQESVATIRGIDSTFTSVTRLREFIREGSFSLYHGEIPEAVLGRTLASNLGLRVHFVEPLYLYFPSRYRSVSLINPASALNQERVFPSGIFAIEQQFDKKHIFVSISVARNLLEYDNEVTSVELYLNNEGDVYKAQREFKELLGDDYHIKDRYQQNETLYKMMKSEKLSIYIILFFILIVISCNLFGSLSMLIIEKSEDAVTLKSLGATEALIKRVFVTEGWMISLLGILCGTAAALLVCFIQQTFGVIPMPGNFIIDSYPVVVKFSDIVLTVCGIATIGFFAAKLPFLIIKKVENF